MEIISRGDVSARATLHDKFAARTKMATAGTEMHFNLDPVVRREQKKPGLGFMLWMALTLKQRWPD
jgi:hypothetical protein